MRPIYIDMGYTLRPQLAYALVDRWTVFLDIAADRYWCLGNQAGKALTKIAADKRLDPADLAAVRALLETGLLSIDVIADVVPPSVSIHSASDLPSAGSASVRLPDLLGACWHIARHRLYCRNTSLIDAISDLAGHNSRCAPATTNPAKTAACIATAFNQVSIVLGSHDRCLPRSFALAHHLAAQNIPSQLVFGVAMDPFCAHCWVQHDGVVLNDRLDHVRTFTPILVV